MKEEDSAFNGCESLTSMIIPNSVMDIGLSTPEFMSNSNPLSTPIKTINESCNSITVHLNYFLFLI